MSSSRPVTTKFALGGLIEQATVDCYNEVKRAGSVVIGS